MSDAQKAEARRAIYQARTSWAAMRATMATPYATPDVPGFTPQRELRATVLAQRVTSDGYLAGYIAGRLLEELPPPNLPVIFRVDGEGEVTAVFPTLAATASGDFTIYAHVGQHGAGSLGWYRTTKPAAPALYAPLLAELRRIYETGDDRVTLMPCKVMTPTHRKACARSAKRGN